MSKKGHWKDNDGNEYSMDDYSDREEIVRSEFENNNLDDEFRNYLDRECIDFIDEFISNCGDMGSLWESKRDAFIEDYAAEVFEENIGESFTLGGTDLTWFDEEPEVKKTRKAIILVEIEIPEEDPCVKSCFDKTIQYALEKCDPIKLEVRTLSDVVSEVKTEDKEDTE